jgi:hypothetical protein
MSPRIHPGVRSLVCALILLIVLTVVLPACRGKQDEAPPVASVSVSMSRDRVAIGSPVKFTYRFDVAQNAKIDGDYRVFVHVLDPDGERLWDDDHVPSVPSSQWKPGQHVEYTRTVFVPNYPYIGEARVRVGLYLDDKRLPLAGTEVSRREYEVARFQLLPQSENIFLIYKDGWHPAEVAADNPASEWQWTQKAGTISFRNPKKDATFYLEYDARTDLFNPSQQVTVRLAGQTIGTFPASSRDRALITFPVSAAQFGTGDMSEIVIEVDKTFKPGGNDQRELGIRVFHAFVEPK